MIAWGITPDELTKIANELDRGLVVKFGNAPSSKCVSFTLRLNRPLKADKAADDFTYRHKSISWSHERWTNSVCFHGHYDFMYEVFLLNPKARIKSARADYRGFDDFVDKAENIVAYTKIGPPITGGYPTMIESCECGAYGYGIVH